MHITWISHVYHMPITSVSHTFITVVSSKPRRTQTFITADQIDARLLAATPGPPRRRTLILIDVAVTALPPSIAHAGVLRRVGAVAETVHAGLRGAR